MRNFHTITATLEMIKSKWLLSVVQAFRNGKSKTSVDEDEEGQISSDSESSSSDSSEGEADRLIDEAKNLLVRPKAEGTSSSTSSRAPSVPSSATSPSVSEMRPESPGDFFNGLNEKHHHLKKDTNVRYYLCFYV